MIEGGGVVVGLGFYFFLLGTTGQKDRGGGFGLDGAVVVGSWHQVLPPKRLVAGTVGGAIGAKGVERLCCSHKITIIAEEEEDDVVGFALTDDQTSSSSSWVGLGNNNAKYARHW
jgi:hypothetical protein